MSSSVTAALRASARPSTVVPVMTLMAVRAMIVPTNLVPVPSVAELPTCQYTLQACAPSVNATVLFEAVMRVSAIWKTHTAVGSPPASSVTVPVKPAVVPV